MFELQNVRMTRCSNYKKFDLQRFEFYCRSFRGFSRDLKTFFKLTKVRISRVRIIQCTAFKTLGVAENCHEETGVWWKSAFGMPISFGAISFFLPSLVISRPKTHLHTSHHNKHPLSQLCFVPLSKIEFLLIPLPVDLPFHSILVIHISKRLDLETTIAFMKGDL